MPRSSPHLFVDISSHGFGHLAQVAPVLNAVLARQPDLRLTVRSGLPPEKLHARIHGAFTHIRERSDFGFVMHDAVRIDAATTARAYREFHAGWPRRVAEEAGKLLRMAPDLILTDVAYLPLAGAVLAGIPALSMCSLNWADLFAHVFGHEPWAGSIHDEMLAAYLGAECFLRPTPSMPMPDLPRALAVAPIAAPGKNRRDELRGTIFCPPDEKLVLVAFGGFDKDLDAARWPRTRGLRWLVPQCWQLERGDMTAIETLDFPFTDLLASVDAALTKPGYGTFTEAACNGTPVLYVRRDDWPEQDYLIEWLKANARCGELDEAELCSGQLQPALDALWRKPARPVPVPSGAGEAAGIILDRLGYPENRR